MCFFLLPFFFLNVLGSLGCGLVLDLVGFVFFEDVLGSFWDNFVFKTRQCFNRQSLVSLLYILDMLLNVMYWIVSKHV